MSKETAALEIPSSRLMKVLEEFLHTQMRLEGVVVTGFKKVDGRSSYRIEFEMRFPVEPDLSHRANISYVRDGRN